MIFWGLQESCQQCITLQNLPHLGKAFCCALLQKGCFLPEFKNSFTSRMRAWLITRWPPCIYLCAFSFPCHPYVCVPNCTRMLCKSKKKSKKARTDSCPKTHFLSKMLIVLKDVTTEEVPSFQEWRKSVLRCASFSF